MALADENLPLQLQEEAQSRRRAAGNAHFPAAYTKLQTSVKERELAAGKQRFHLKTYLLKVPGLRRLLRVAAAVLRLPLTVQELRSEIQGLHHQLHELQKHFAHSETVARSTADDIKMLFHQNHKRFAEGEVFDKRMQSLRKEIGEADRSWREAFSGVRARVNAHGADSQDKPAAASGTVLTEALLAKLDTFYWRFEERFRGSQEAIRERLQVYLPYLQKIAAGGQEPLVDLGCGRGEWLRIAQENGLKASGVDLNKKMIGVCKEATLDVTYGDALAYLKSLPLRSCGAVTGFHIVEHLPFETLFALLCEAHRVLRPGGLVIFETPNPENIDVGTCNFYTDPTHRNPLPPPSLGFLLEEAGFGQQECLRLAGRERVSTQDLTQLDPALSTLVERFYVGGDYAIIGFKADGLES